MSAFDLQGKVALVTGGNGGIGLGMAAGLAAAGADVVIWGSNPDKNARAEKLLKSHGRRVLAQRCDVSYEAQVEEGFAAALKVMGRIDGCFANAGVSQARAPLSDLPTQEWRRVMQVNLDGAFFTLRAAARHMTERAKAGDAGGRLVGMASSAAIHGAARAASYAATKGAMLTMIRALAVEMARYQVTANSILPGWIESDMTAAAIGDARFSAAVLPRIPLRRWGKKEDFSGIAVYQMSDASGYHTGDHFVIDGAYTLF
jgi:NAD(P)-dependent dehydrogenase (short-subunit alcohol dehydrogenase family)